MFSITIIGPHEQYITLTMNDEDYTLEHSNGEIQVIANDQLFKAINGLFPKVTRCEHSGIEFDANGLVTAINP
jgi:hypothetical protein